MTDKKKQISRTYRLSQESVDIIEKLVKEFSKRLGSQMPYSKLIDSLIYYCKDVTFSDITTKDKRKSNK